MSHLFAPESFFLRSVHEMLQLFLVFFMLLHVRFLQLKWNENKHVIASCVDMCWYIVFTLLKLKWAVHDNANVIALVQRTGQDDVLSTVESSWLQCACRVNMLSYLLRLWSDGAIDRSAPKPRLEYVKSEWWSAVILQQGLPMSFMLD